MKRDRSPEKPFRRGNGGLLSRSRPYCRFLIYILVVFAVYSMWKLLTKQNIPDSSPSDDDHDDDQSSLAHVDVNTKPPKDSPSIRTGEELSLAERKRARLYCMVPSMYPENISKMRAILETWGNDCDVLKFFVDPPPIGDEDSIPKEIVDPTTGRKADIVIVNMIRKTGASVICSDGLPCRHIWEKVWRSWVYVYDHDIHSADWFSKIDDDTFNIMPNLQEYVSIIMGWSPDDIHYFGHWVDTGDKQTLISGVFATLSRAALEKVAPVFKSMPHEYGDRSKFERGRCVDRDGATEERTFSKCLSTVGIIAEGAFDDSHNGCERVLPLGVPFMLTYKRKKDTTSWFWEGKPWTRGDRNNCCCFDAYAIHGYKSGTRMKQMYEILYEWSDEAIELMMKENKEKIGPNRSLIPESKEAITHAHDMYWFFWYITEMRKHLKQNPFSNWKGGGTKRPESNWYLLS